VLIGLTLLCLGVGVAAVPATPTSHALNAYAADVERADAALATLASARDAKTARAAFLEARVAYKRIEWLAEHYTPLTAAALNGPAVDTPDEENPKVIVRPTGLQVIEAMLYRPDSGRSVLDSVAIQARIARVNVRRVRERVGEASVTDAQLFDAARIQVARIVTLGIAGFDTPLSTSAMPEAAASIRALAHDLSAFAVGTPEAEWLQRTARLSANYLDRHSAFVSFDRFIFTTQYANPLARQIGQLQRAARVARLNDPRPWLASANTVFDRGAFDPSAFAPPGDRRSAPQLVALGERLFNDAQLSAENNRSCASCHAANRGFADGQRVPALLATRNTERPRRNTPTLYNAALQAAAFADARIAFLEDQVTTVVNDPREMGGNLEQTATSLHGDASYRGGFTQAFGAMPARGDMSRAVRSALAAYMRSLVRLDSRFDRAMRGEESALGADERRGFNLFMGKARCGTCHFAPLFNGTVPPGFTESEVEVIGVPAGAQRNAKLDPDRGAGATDMAPLHDFAFKTPTVRNAAVTAPYMHNGVFRTLDEVVDFYDAGGGAGRGLRVPNQTLPADSLHLTRREKRDLVAFMRALTDTAGRPPLAALRGADANGSAAPRP
jgi:cytochrome c peroxidase